MLAKDNLTAIAIWCLSLVRSELQPVQPGCAAHGGGAAPLYHRVYL